MPKKRTLLSDDPWANEINTDDSITKKVITFISQPAYLTILLTAIFYLIIANYYVNYFGRLSIPFNVLNLPFTFYLESGYNFLVIIFLITITGAFFLMALGALALYKKDIAYSLKSIRYTRILFKLHTKRSIRKSLIFISFSEFTDLVLTIITGVLILAISIIAALSSYEWVRFFLPQQSFKDWVFLNFLIAMLIITPIIIKYIAKNDYLFDIKLSKLFIFMYLFLILLSVEYIPSTMGVSAAEDLIRGDGLYSEAQLYLKDQNINLSNKTLIFITQCNGNYYLVEKSNPVPKTAKLYIVSEKEVKMLLIERYYHYSNKHSLMKNVSWQHFW